MAIGSIDSWDALGDALTRHFEDKSDYLSLVEQLTTIKRAPQEQMMDFNNRFQRTWTRISVSVRPSTDHAFLYFLKSLNSDISVMIQSMGGVSLPRAYDISIRAENSLIQVGKIAPRPPMPIFADIQLNMPLAIPPFNPLPIVPSQEIDVAGPSQELQEIKKNSQLKIQNMMQTFSNELVNLKNNNFMLDHLINSKIKL